MPTPSNEPVAYSTLVALLIAAAVSYGLPITDELTQFLVTAVPILVAAIVARSKVTPTSKL